ncbi:hypothetical protein [Streptomyces spectabilis]|uniref:Uncharacterized protein n=1 Tax=Streptomyces spectabilis TaxID=68270 RepID=A0A516RJG3_STRST|nr:hypothetical protein [Streptomyces spectabilis]QDQ15806.1 hypothetical protein FH965_38995 [Streptomyces spectabilis]
MSDALTTPTGLESQYATQLATDLERNATDQERIGTEVQSLQEQLRALQHDRELLLKMQQLLANGPAGAVRQAGASRTARVPAPRESAPRTKRTVRKKAAAAVKAKPQPKPKSAEGPTLIELVRGHLGQQAEPRSAAEVTTALTQGHPERTIKTTVVRTTLEKLVAKGQAQRTRQKNSVFYSTPDATEQAERSGEGAAAAEKPESKD